MYACGNLIDCNVFYDLGSMAIHGLLLVLQVLHIYVSMIKFKCNHEYICIFLNSKIEANTVSVEYYVA